LGGNDVANFVPSLGKRWTGWLHLKIAIKIFLCEKMSSALGLSNVKKVCDLDKKRRLREAIKKIANFCPPTTFLSKFATFLPLKFDTQLIFN
jgi:hypothetical protein